MAELKLPGVDLSRFQRSKKERPKVPTASTAVDWDAATVRVVNAVTRGGAGVVTSAVMAPLSLPADADRSSAEVMGRALAQAFEQARLKPGAVVMAVPRSQVILKTLLVPVVEDVADLAAVVHLQLAKDLPFRATDAVIDFRINRQVQVAAAKTGPETKPAAPATTTPADAPPEGPVNKLEISVAVVKSEVVGFYQKLAEVAGVKLTALGLGSYATGRCVLACTKDLAGTKEPFAVISVRAGEIGIDVMANGALGFSRGAVIKPVGEEGKRELPINALAIEAVRSLRSYLGMGGEQTVGRVLVTGGTGVEPALASAVGQALERSVEVLNLGTQLGLEAGQRDAAAGAASAAGLALGMLDANSLPIDFLNPKKPAVERDLRRVRILLSVVAVGCVCFALFGLRSWLVGKKQKILTAVNLEADAAEKKRSIYRQMIQQSTVVSEWVKGEKDWLDHYAYLSAVLPPSEEVHITSFAVTGQKALRLAVQARSGEILAKVEKQLRAAGYEVKPLSITPGVDRNGYDFRSNVELLVPDKLKIDLSKVKATERPADDGSLDPISRKGGG